MDPTSLLAAWDLTRPRQRLGREHPALGTNQLERIVTGYRHFLFLRLRYPQERLVPHRAVDEMWHQHLLHTRDYAALCEKVLGGFFHHEPSPPDAASTARDRHDYGYTRALVRHHFGATRDPETWLADALATMEDPA